MASHHRGQASVELIALLPLLAAGALAIVQVVLAGHAAWALSGAARAAARAQATGHDPAAAARAALPEHLDRRVRVRPGESGAVEVSLRIPTALPALDLGTLTTSAHFEPQAP